MEKSDKIKLSRLIIALVIFVIAFVMEKIGVFSLLKWYITLVIFIIPYLIAGYDVVLEALENIFHGEVFDEAFLMMLASVAAFAIGEYEEATAVMIFYQIGELLSDLAVDRSRESIEELMNICPEYANLQTDDGIIQAEPGNVKISDVIIIKAGERIPLDGVVIEGTSYIDTSALTGESVMREVKAGTEVLSGCLNGEGTFKLRVTKEYEDSTVKRILDMVENTAEKKSKTESFINRFARVYTPTVTILALLLAILPPLIMGQSGMGYNFALWIRRACTFLVISCPCALVISVPLSFFAGIGAASSNGILIKGGTFLEMLSGIKVIAFDKTGTVTEGNFVVKDIEIYDNDFSRKDVLKLAASIELYSDHPIAKSILKECEAVFGGNEKVYANANVSNIEEIPGNGIGGVIDGKRVLLGNEKLIQNYVNQDSDAPIKKTTGFDNNTDFDNNTCVYLIYDSKLIACVIIGDEIKSSSAEAIHSLKRLGIDSCVMLTGDRKSYAQSVAKLTGIDEVRAELLPDEKVSAIEELIDRYHTDKKAYVAFAGDGINDAPSLMRADIGIAMGIGADAAIEAADVVLADNNLMQIIKAIKISRKTVRIATENITFALIVKLIVLVLGALGIASMWLAVFADVGVALLAILNAMRAKI